jgi:hypothetical protein
MPLLTVFYYYTMAFDSQCFLQKLIYTYLHADFEIGDSDLDSDDDSSHGDPLSNTGNVF